MGKQRIVTGDITFEVQEGFLPHTLTIHKLDRITGIAGQYAFVVTYTRAFLDGSGAQRYTDSFSSSIYGGPIALQMGEYSTLVHDPERFAPSLTRAWVASFLGLPNGALDGDGLHTDASGEVRSGKD